MAIVGLVPARGGSKSIPLKNLAAVAGRSLLEIACAEARAARTLGDVVVSTDDERIENEARRLGIPVLRRPPDLATDEAPMLGVLQHAVRELGVMEALVLLQPTSPLRRAAHIDDAVGLFRSSGADSVVSVVRVPHNFVPSSLFRLEGTQLVALEAEAPSRRQDKAVLYARNGPAIVVTRPDVILDGSLYGRDVCPYVMNERDSLDIDSPWDLALAGLLLGEAPTSLPLA